MRVLVVSALYPPHVAGAAELYTAWITEALRARGHELTVLTSWHGMGGPQVSDGTWRLLTFYPSQRYDSGTGIVERLRSAYLYFRCHNSPHNGATLREVLRRVAPELVYLAEPSGLGLNSIIRAINAARLPVVIHLHNYWLLYIRRPEAEQSRFKNTRLKRLLVGPVPRVAYTLMIAVSRLVKDEHVRAGFQGERIEVIYNGIPRETLPQVSPGPRPKQPRFLLAARLVEEKGVHIAISAVAHLVKGLGASEAHLDIVGDGYPSYVEQLKALSRRLGVSDNVTLCGKLDRETLLRGFANYVAVLLPSLWKEPFATTALEAMAMGVPIIASRLGGHAEVIEDGRTGLLFEPGDAEQLAQRMHMLLLHPDMQERIARNALRVVGERLGFESFVDSIEDHLERALSAAAASKDSGATPLRPNVQRTVKGF